MAETAATAIGIAGIVAYNISPSPVYRAAPTQGLKSKRLIMTGDTYRITAGGNSLATQQHVYQTGEWFYESEKFECQTAGYYFNARKNNKRNVSRLLRSLVLQLYPKQLPPKLEELYNKCLSQEFADNHLFDVLEDLIGTKDQTYIVTDALDECDASFRSGEKSEVEKLVNFISWLTAKAPNLHLLVTSRDGGLASDVEQKLSNIGQEGRTLKPYRHIIDLQTKEMKTNINTDIGKVVELELERWNGRKGKGERDITEIIDLQGDEKTLARRSPATGSWKQCDTNRRLVDTKRALEFLSKRTNRNRGDAGGGTHFDIGTTALRLAVKYERDVIAKLLLEKGADPNEKFLPGNRFLQFGDQAFRGCGWTALHEAAYHGREAIVPLLLEKNADVHIKDDSGQTAKHIAASRGHMGIVRLLEDNERAKRRKRKRNE
ncbi:hypothetical protein CHU98_g217 [Xylaria longipes]|nr:hypothetical protein CHU98_g217 [Xylaria longipes]